MATPAVPGAVNVATLTGSEIVGIATAGPQVAQTTTGAIAALVTSKTGTVTINGVTPVTVANTNIDANSLVIFTLKTVGGTVGAIPVVETITPGTGFTAQGTASDTSTYNYLILN